MMRIETKRLYLRQMTDDDFELMSRIWLERSPTLFDGDKEFQEKVLRELWESNQGPNTLTGLVFLQDGNHFCGRVNMQKTDENVPELGVDLLAAYQNKGYGPETITAFANWYGESRHILEIKVLITAVNTHSAHEFQKLGAEYIQENPSSLTAAKSLAETLPEKREAIMRNLSVREYLLKLPIMGISNTAL